MVRDDFWLAVSRFMQGLEIPVFDGENIRLVDLFDPRHAGKVLAAFGRAFGALPAGGLSREQDAFLAEAVAGLAVDGKVISVRWPCLRKWLKASPGRSQHSKMLEARLVLASPSWKRRSRPAPPPPSSPPSEGGSGGTQSPAARERDRHQGPHAIAARAAGRVALREPCEGF